MAGLIEFETARLRLRQWSGADREPLASLNADPRVMEFFPSVLDRPASETMFDRLQSAIAERGWGFWAAEAKETHEFIGFVGLGIPEAPLPFLPCVEIGWRLAFEHWGKGFATEAGSGALRVGFELLGLEEIVSFTAVQNRRSRGVMRRLGMLEESTTFEHPQVPIGSPIREHCLYRMSKGRWNP